MLASTGLTKLLLLPSKRLMALHLNFTLDSDKNVARLS
jgi:hypothetical protein